MCKKNLKNTIILKYMTNYLIFRNLTEKRFTDKCNIFIKYYLTNKELLYFQRYNVYSARQV